MQGWVDRVINNVYSRNLNVLGRGFVTYSFDAKVQMLGVERKLIEETGELSVQVSLEMVSGAITNSNV